MRRRIMIGLMVTVLTVGLAGTASAAATEYVALGDSAAAGPLILPQDSLACLRAKANYPHVAAAALGIAKIKDVTCSSATTADLAGSQQTPGGAVPPQFDALSPSTTLVTLTMGGNDIGLVGEAMSCINLLPFGNSCAARFNAGGVDQLAKRIIEFEPKWGAALDAIHQKASHASVYVVGYGTYLPHNGCWPIVPITDVDANYVQATIGRLNAALARQAAAHHARFIDIQPPSVGHDVCRLPGVKWFEGLIPTSIAAPLHPNRLGMSHIGTYVAGFIANKAQPAVITVVTTG